MGLTKERLLRRIKAAQGSLPSDLIIKNVNFLDVFSCEWRQGDIAIFDGVIVGLEPGLSAKRTLEARGQTVVPGFIDAHVHIESTLLVPKNFQKAVLPRGTTGVICDPHEIANVRGIKGLEYFLSEAEGLALDMRVMLSSCVPATNLETNGAGTLGSKDLLSLAKHPKALGLAEVMNFSGVLNGDPDLLSKLEIFSGGAIDGHCPLVRGQALSAYAASGISSCHESTTLEEASEKLTKGISIWIREGGVAKDLNALTPLITLANSTSIGFCTDDRNPLNIVAEGHIDHLIRQSLKAGVPAEVAYRVASWSVARHYGLRHRGAIAPGYLANLVLLNDVKTCAIDRVWIAGTLASELPMPAVERSRFENTVRAQVPEIKDLEGPKGRVHVIGVNPGKILTDRLVMEDSAPGVRRLTVLERHGKGRKPANAYVLGFGDLNGAIASSVGHDSHNLIVVGARTSDMRAALAWLVQSGGGFCVVRDGSVIAGLPLPFGGLMSFEDESVLVKSLQDLHKASESIGCVLAEPFLQLAFLSLPVVPFLKLTDQGLVDVNRLQLIDVKVA